MFGFSNFSDTDAIAILRKDHRRVEELFAQFDGETRGERRIAVATSIVQELAVHARVEEDLFYPLALESLDEKGRGLIWEATVEHGTLAGLIEALGGADADDESFDAHLKVLKEYVKHHVREEEYEIFPRIRATDIDLESLGSAMTVRKQELAQMLKDEGNGASPRGSRSAAQRARA